MAVTIAALVSDGPPSKLRGDRIAFLYPNCGEMFAYVNPNNTLAHCFAYHKNLNNINLLITQGHNFLSAVELLEQWLEQYQAHRHRDNTTARPSIRRPNPKSRKRLRHRRSIVYVLSLLSG